jgi:hypothetical protein
MTIRRIALDWPAIDDGSGSAALIDPLYLIDTAWLLLALLDLYVILHAGYLAFELARWAWRKRCA